MNRDYFTSFSVEAFYFFSCLIALTGTSSTKLNRSGECQHPCLVPDLRRNTFSLLPLSIMFTIGFPYIDFDMSRQFPFIPSLLSNFIIKGC